MTDDNKEKVLNYIALTQMKGICSVTQNCLLDLFGDIEFFFQS